MVTTEQFFKDRGEKLSKFNFSTDTWTGTQEELYEIQYHLEELKKAGDIELEINKYFGGEMWYFKGITPQGRMKLAGKLPKNNSALIEQKETPLKCFPIFGQPKQSLKSSWSDIFVIMPFLSNLKSVYTDHILKVAEGLNLKCERGDDFFSTQAIIDEIWAATYYSKLCIADCTGRNPNVFYELGIAHTLGRPVILIAQSIDDIPFDIRHRRVITYEYTPPGMEDFEDKLLKTIKTELKLL